MELSLTFSDEFEGELDVEGVGAVQIPGHDHSHTILQSKVTATVYSRCICVVYWFVVSLLLLVFRRPTPLKIRAVPDFRGSPLRVPLSAPYNSGHVSC